MRGVIVPYATSATIVSEINFKNILSISVTSQIVYLSKTGVLLDVPVNHRLSGFGDVLLLYLWFGLPLCTLLPVVGDIAKTASLVGRLSCGW